ncbi:hypothetical protein BP6252_07382 [Coleophoma cylindrospora]|uniref:Protein kinase domain-containing protein n=1 Tax=Coleophoma cylindrospora TaxID=1849047 RepID=A0A3D8RHE2_9HELO|nr:hypothetical protein BP6252_07382 [Coleophoma cylindrospora]
MGDLKISDFGLMQFHRKRSKSHIDASGVGVSRTYRAPEYDIAREVSQSYDIWTFGCLILEFITWYLLGWDKVDKFSRRRVDDDNSEFREDVFFNLVKIRSEEASRVQLGARFKPSVAKEFLYLSEQKHCSDFMLDLLEFVENRLLRMGPRKRADCEEIVTKLTELQKLCVEDPMYSTGRVKISPRRTRTNLSELLPAAALEFSDEMDEQIKRMDLPEHTRPLESDLYTPKSPHPGNMLHETGSNNFDLPRMVQNLPKSKDLQSPDGEQNSRPQSPVKKVHFEANKSQPRNPGGLEYGDGSIIIGD